MATLYELTDAYRTLMDMLQDPECDEQAVLDTMEGIDGEFEIKAEGYAKIIQQLSSDAAALKAEASRLSERRATIEKRVDWLKETLKHAMIETGKTKFKTQLFSFGVQKNPPSVILETDDIPERFLIHVDPKVDKAAISEALKSGEDLSGIAHFQQTTRISIR